MKTILRGKSGSHYAFTDTGGDPPVGCDAPDFPIVDAPPISRDFHRLVCRKALAGVAGIVDLDPLLKHDQALKRITTYPSIGEEIAVACIARRQRVEAAGPEDAIWSLAFLEDVMALHNLPLTNLMGRIIRE